MKSKRLIGYMTLLIVFCVVNFFSPPQNILAEEEIRAARDDRDVHRQWKSEQDTLRGLAAGLRVTIEKLKSEGSVRLAFRYSEDLGPVPESEKRDFECVVGLHLGGYLIDDELLHFVAQFKGLENLSIRGNFSNTGLTHLSKLENLKSVTLSSGQITDAGLTFLQKSERLVDLDLRLTSLRSTSLQHVANPAGLRNLFMPQGSINDEEMKALLEFNSLRFLSINDNDVTDAGVGSIVKLRKLKGLNLAGTLISDKGLRELQKLEKLEWLHLDGVKVSENGVRELRARFQDLEILGK